MALVAEGQREILAGYGIVEEYVGCPIISSMEVKKIGVNDEGVDVKDPVQRAASVESVSSSEFKVLAAVKGEEGSKGGDR